MAGAILSPRSLTTKIQQPLSPSRTPIESFRLGEVGWTRITNIETRGRTRNTNLENRTILPFSLLFLPGRGTPVREHKCLM